MGVGKRIWKFPAKLLWSILAVWISFNACKWSRLLEWNGNKVLSQDNVYSDKHPHSHHHGQVLWHLSPWLSCLTPITVPGLAATPRPGCLLTEIAATLPLHCSVFILLTTQQETAGSFMWQEVCLVWLSRTIYSWNPLCLLPLYQWSLKI